MSDRWSLRAPLTGVVFVVLLVIAFAVTGGSPDVKAGGAKVISYYKAHSGSERAGAILGAIAAVFWLFFAGSLRDHLRRFGASDGLAATAFGGAVLFAVGDAIFSALGFTLSDSPGSLDPAAAQALNVLGNDLFFPLAVGNGVFLLANGLAIVRGKVLPAWLGWAAIVLGVLAVSPAGFVAFVGLGIWTLIAAGFMLTGAGRAESTPLARPEQAGAASP